MHIKIDKGECGANRGSVRRLVRYLEKEDKCAEGSKTPLFFDQERTGIEASSVMAALDGNTGKLGSADAKYFMVTISPSVRELRHLGECPWKLLRYARGVMEHYAAGFERGLTGSDLLYFGKLEHRRTFTGLDPAVQAGYVSRGLAKPGPNLHVHIIVSRKDRHGRSKLSPMTNHRKATGGFQGGFDRVGFFHASQALFDTLFSYPRLAHERFGYGVAHQSAAFAQLDPLVLPLQRVLFYAQQDRPSLALFALRLQRQGIGLEFHADQRGVVDRLSYRILPAAFPHEMALRVPAAVDEAQLALLMQRGYSDVISKVEGAVQRRGKQKLVRGA